MSPLTSHVLDTARGTPARGLAVRIERFEGAWIPVAQGSTNDDGRVPGLLQPGELTPGEYRAIFETGAWFAAAGTKAFYPVVHVVFTVEDPDQHYHIPLLLSPYGYSTYRGS